jgi:hypothetical protein
MLDYASHYLKLTAACQTNARRIKRTGITGIKSTIGENGAYASGSFAINPCNKIRENITGPKK